MATTKKAAAKKAAPKKSAAKKPATKKTTVKKVTVKKVTVTKTTASKPAAKKPASPATAVRESLASAAREADETVKQYTAVANDQLADLLALVRDIVDTSIGLPFAIQARLSEASTVPTVDLSAVKAVLDDTKRRLGTTPSVDLDAVKVVLEDTKALLDEAKGEGHARLAAAQQRVQPVADSVGKRIDEAAGLIEAQLPSQLTDLIESGRARFRTLIAA